MRTTEGDDDMPLSSALLEEDAKTWLAEVPEYGGTRVRATKGDDDM